MRIQKTYVRGHTADVTVKSPKPLKKHCWWSDISLCATVSFFNGVIHLVGSEVIKTIHEILVDGMTISSLVPSFDHDTSANSPTYLSVYLSIYLTIYLSIPYLWWWRPRWKMMAKSRLNDKSVGQGHTYTYIGYIYISCSYVYHTILSLLYPNSWWFKTNFQKSLKSNQSTRF